MGLLKLAGASKGMAAVALVNQLSDQDVHSILSPSEGLVAKPAPFDPHIYEHTVRTARDFRDMPEEWWQMANSMSNAMMPASPPQAHLALSMPSHQVVSEAPGFGVDVFTVAMNTIAGLFIGAAAWDLAQKEQVCGPNEGGDSNADAQTEDGAATRSMCAPAFAADMRCCCVETGMSVDPSQCQDTKHLCNARAGCKFGPCIVDITNPIEEKHELIVVNQKKVFGF